MSNIKYSSCLCAAYTQLGMTDIVPLITISNVKLQVEIDVLLTKNVFDESI